MNRITPTAALLAAVLSACGGSEEAPAADAPVADVPAAESTPATASAPAQARTDLLDPNTAPREELLTVPGITGPAADALVQGRPYADMLAVDRVLSTHLEAEERKRVYARLWKPLDLNRASGEEILLIPGVGPRMQHEFEEYRPYGSMEEFRREIGKYVNDAEVARLERYVALR